MEDYFWTLVKRRLVITGLAVLLISAGGIWVAAELVVQRVAETPLRELQKEVVRAEIQADGAKRASDTAKTSAEHVTAGLNGLNTILEGLGEQAKAIESRFALMNEQINAASDNARRRSQQDFDAVQRRIAALEALVKQIGEDSAASRKATAEYAKQIAALESKVERDQKRFAENSAYTVSILFDPSKKGLATEVQARLAALGFRAPLHELPSNAAKGNSLSYQASTGDAKAQEVLALLKPLVRDLQEKKLAVPEKSEPSISKKTFDKLEFKPAAGIVFSLLMSGLDPKSLQLQLGAS
jgi:chromosome segregation ATPase